MLNTQILTFVFILISIVQILYYLGVFSFFIFSSDTTNDVSEEMPTSILIAAKNETVNLVENLPFYRNQKHTKFELILINDHSTDDTFKILNRFKKENPFLDVTIVNLESQDNSGNKKKALTKGIEIAKYPNLLFTDADCKPNSNEWIQLMTKKRTNKQVVLGYGAYQKIPKSWLNKLIRFETVMTALQYFSYAKIGIPYMGVGRNLAYKKQLFTDNNGFVTHQHIKSGDDDLFVNQVATKKNTAICYVVKAHTISKVHTNFKKWLHQKKRHISTANKYQKKHQVLLALFYMTNFLFWFLGLFLIAIYPTKLLLIIFLLRILIQYFYLYKTACKLNEKDLVIFVPILELFLITIQLYLFFANIFVKPKTW